MARADLGMVRETLAQLMGPGVDVRPFPDESADGIVLVGKNKFILAIKGSARSQTIAEAMMRLEHIAHNRKWADHRPLLFVDRMGESGRALCKGYEINWADLSGNADIRGDGLLVQVRGQSAHARIESGKAFNPFSRSASRVVHVLLLHPHEELLQRDIAIQAAQSKGTVSRALSALQQLGFIEPISGRHAKVRVVNWERLLDSWLEIHRAPRPYAGGLVSARDGFDAMRQVAEELRKRDTPCYFSGLAAAAHYTKFGNFRRVLVYADSLPSELRTRFNVSEDMRGRNILFVRDDGNAKLGAEQLGPYNLVSPYLTLMDLAHEPERAEEATEAMRRFIRSMWQ